LRRGEREGEKGGHFRRDLFSRLIVESPAEDVGGARFAASFAHDHDPRFRGGAGGLERLSGLVALLSPFRQRGSALAKFLREDVGRVGQQRRAQALGEFIIGNVSDGKTDAKTADEILLFPREVGEGDLDLISGIEGEWFR